MAYAFEEETSFPSGGDAIPTQAKGAPRYSFEDALDEPVKTDRGYSFESAVDTTYNTDTAIGADTQQVKQPPAVPFDSHENDQSNAYMRGLKSYIPSAQALLYGTGAFVSDIVGAKETRNSLLTEAQKYQQEAASYAKPDETGIIKSISDGGDFWGSLAYGLGSATGSMLETGAAGLAGAALGGGIGSVPAMFGKTVAKEALANYVKKAAMGAVLASSAKEGYGGTYLDAVAEKGGEDLSAKDLARVGFYGSISTGLDYLGDKIGLGAIGDVAKGTVGKAGSEVFKGIATEGLTEAGQTISQQLGAGKSVTDRESIYETLDSGIIGGIMGGARGVGVAAGGKLMNQYRDTKAAEAVGQEPQQSQDRPQEAVSYIGDTEASMPVETQQDVPSETIDYSTGEVITNEQPVSEQQGFSFEQAVDNQETATEQAPQYSFEQAVDEATAIASEQQQQAQEQSPVAPMEQLVDKRYKPEILRSSRGDFMVQMLDMQAFVGSEQEATALASRLQSSNNPLVTFEKIKLQQLKEGAAKTGDNYRARALIAKSEDKIARLVKLYGDEEPVVVAPKPPTGLMTSALEGVVNTPNREVATQTYAFEQDAQPQEQVTQTVPQGTSSIPVTNYPTINEVPQPARDAIVSKAKGAIPSAFYDTKTGNIATIGKVNQATVDHEVGHLLFQRYAATQGMNNENTNNAVNHLIDYASRNTFVSDLSKRIAKQRGINIKSIEGKREAVSEAIAEVYAGAKNPDKNYLKTKYGISQNAGATKNVGNIVGRIKSLLGQSGMSNAEFMDMIGEMDRTAIPQQQQVAPAQSQEEIDFERYQLMLDSPIDATIATVKERLTIAGKSVSDQWLGSENKFGKLLNWYHTQLHKAQVNPLYGGVWKAIANYSDDTQKFTMMTAMQAPTLFPQKGRFMHDLKTLFDQAVSLGGTVRAAQADVKAVAKPIFDGTLQYKRDANGNIVFTDNVEEAGLVWSPEELSSRYQLTAKQIGMYSEYRNSIDFMTNLSAISFMNIIAEQHNGKLESANTNLDSQVDATLRIIDDFYGSNPDETSALMRGIARKKVMDLHNTAMQSAEKGYAPLKRFGKFALHYYDQNGKETYMHFDTQYQRDLFANEVRKRDPNANVRVNTVPQAEYQLYEGVSLDTVELWAKQMAIMNPDKKALLDDFRRVAISQNSILKHSIARGGMAGYSEDILRGLSSYAAGNARMVAGNHNDSAINNALLKLKTYQEDGMNRYRDGGVMDEATNLVKYAKGSSEGGGAVNNFLYATYLYGSMASAALNLTSVPMITYPVLTRYASDTAVLGAMAKYSGIALKGIFRKGFTIEDKGIEIAYKTAMQSGILEPNEYYNFMQRHKNSSNFDEAVSKVLSLTSAPFGTIDEYTRHLTFLMALDVAKGMTQEQFAAEQVSNSIEFAEKMVSVTQGRHTKDTMPNIGRNKAGAILLCLKRYQINYLEVLQRMPPAQRLRMAGVVVLIGGVSALPFMGNAEDLIDGIGQSMGYMTNSKKFRRDALNAIFGDYAKVIEYGALDMFGADISTRVSLAKPIPATGVVVRAEPDKLKSASEILGVGGSYAFNVVGALTGDKGIDAVLPVAVGNAIRAYKMATTGAYKDARGNKITDVSGYDAAMKLLGMMPTAVRDERAAIGYNNRTNFMFKKIRGDFINDAANAIVTDDKVRLDEIRQEVQKWQANNPDMRLGDLGKPIRDAVQRKRMTLSQRYEKTTPQALRQQMTK